MDIGSMPDWAQIASTLSIVIITVTVGLYKYFNTEVKDSSKKENNSLSAGILTDDRLVKELTEAIRYLREDSGRDAKRTHRVLSDLRDSIDENTEALMVQTDTSTNLLKFISRNNRVPRTPVSQDEDASFLIP